VLAVSNCSDRCSCDRERVSSVISDVGMFFGPWC
jgi:redox-regulated HSP33 family molecular chaperone